MMNNWFKKEKPLPSLMSFGGGAGGNAVAGPKVTPTAWNGVGASGGTTYDYTSPLGEFRVHKFTSTSATPFSAPGSFDRKVKYIIVGGGGGGGSPAGPPGAGGAGGGGAGAVLDATNGPGNSGSGIDLSGPFNFNVTCGAGGEGAPYLGDNGEAGSNTTVAFPTGTITAPGGGYGGKGNPTADGGPGGSGGGAALYVPKIGGEATGAAFPGVPGDSPPVGWGQDGGPGGYGGKSPTWSPTNPLAPFYVSGGGGGAGGKGISGGTGKAQYPGPTTANVRTAGVGGAGYLLPEIFRSPTNKMFKGVDGPEHWLAGGGGAGTYHHHDSPYEPTAPVPAANGYRGGGGAWSPIPGQPSHPPGSFAGAGSGGLGATPSQGGGGQAVATNAQANSGSGGGAGGGGAGPTVPTGYGGDGGSGVVFLAYSIGSEDPATAAVTGSGGNIEATPGNGYKYHVFSSSGAFTVSGGPGTVEALLVAGGGGGAGLACGSGGGAGGVRSITGIRVSPGPYTITVGEGGAGGQPSYGTSGGDTTAFDLRATGGGGGTGTYSGEPTAPPSRSAGQPGGSGGGAKGQYPTAPGYGAGGQGNIRGVYPVEGYPGGDGSLGNSGAGGGGAGSAGSNAGSGDPASNGGAGGNGAPYPAYAGPLFPTMPTAWKTATGPTGLYGGGGGGGNQNNPGSNQASGGTGGGGDGDTGPGDGSAGTANTGGGGGGGGRGIGFDSPTRGFAGGDGIVIIRYSV